MSRLTIGRLAQHTPNGPGGRYAALIDIAQDLLLTHLYEQRIFDHLVFKGGTALRKLYAGGSGRFSTDLDFSVRHPSDDPAAVLQLLRDEIDGYAVDDFAYHVHDHRGRAVVSYTTPFGGVGNLTTKLDIGPPPWLPPRSREWVRLPVHQAYELPEALPVMALEENMAEKISRLARRTTARDVYDLVWIATTSPYSNIDRATVRRLAVLKTWVDQYGLSSPPAMWSPVSGAVDYDPAKWTKPRSAADFDEDSIGLLAVPPPTLDDLARQLHSRFGFLANPDPTERRIIDGGPASRRLVLQTLGRLPGGRLAGRAIH